MRNFVDMTSGPIRSTLVGQAIPMLFGMVSMVLFNLTDTWFIARLGTRPLAAMSFTLPVVMFFWSCFNGTGCRSCLEQQEFLSESLSHQLAPG